MKAKPLDERKRISESHKGIIPTDETRELLSIRSKERCRSKKGSNKFFTYKGYSIFFRNGRDTEV